MQNNNNNRQSNFTSHRRDCPYVCEKMIRLSLLFLKYIYLFQFFVYIVVYLVKNERKSIIIVRDMTIKILTHQVCSHSIIFLSIKSFSTSDSFIFSYFKNNSLVIIIIFIIIVLLFSISCFLLLLVVVRNNYMDSNRPKKV